MQLIDISRPLDTSIAVWPGDRPYAAEWTAEIGEEGSVVNIGALSMSTHTGTHVDAPLHYDAEGASVDELDLSTFVGPATVIEIEHAVPIQPDDFTAADLSERVLFKTPCSDQSPSEWCEDLAPLSPEAVRELSDAGVVLVGTDAPSVDPVDSKELSGHHACRQHGIHILEGLHLRGVAPGNYELIAMPLPLRGLDASPVRAVLRT